MAKKVIKKPSRGERAKKSNEKKKGFKVKMTPELKEAIEAHEEGVRKSKARADAMRKGEFGKMNYK
jgi:predicted SPOUT superfamily RNA methylase MTH1